MTKQVTKKKPVRKQYTPEYRAEALGLADRVGVPEAARQLGIDGGLIYNWRKASEAKASVSQVEPLAAENARLKRQLAEQTEELAILKKRRRTSRSTRSEVRLHADASP